MDKQDVGGEGELSARQQQTRDRILRAAREQFQARGYEEATIRAIAQAAGVSAATVMIHGESKAALAMRLYRPGLEEVVEQALAGVPAGAPPPLQLAQVLGAALEYLTADRTAAYVVLRALVLPEAGHGPSLAEALRDRLLPLLERGQQAGRLRPDVDPRRFTAATLHLFAGVLSGWLQKPDQPPPLARQELLAALRMLWEGADPWR